MVRSRPPGTAVGVCVVESCHPPPHPASQVRQLEYDVERWLGSANDVPLGAADGVGASCTWLELAAVWKCRLCVTGSFHCRGCALF